MTEMWRRPRKSRWRSKLSCEGWRKSAPPNRGKAVVERGRLFNLIEVCSCLKLCNFRNFVESLGQLESLPDLINLREKTNEAKKQLSEAFKKLAAVMSDDMEHIDSLMEIDFDGLVETVVEAIGEEVEVIGKIEWRNEAMEVMEKRRDDIEHLRENHKAARMIQNRFT